MDHSALLSLEDVSEVTQSLVTVICWSSALFSLHFKAQPDSECMWYKVLYSVSFSTATGSPHVGGILELIITVSLGETALKSNSTRHKHTGTMEAILSLSNPSTGSPTEGCSLHFVKWPQHDFTGHHF